MYGYIEAIHSCDLLRDSCAQLVFAVVSFRFIQCKTFLRGKRVQQPSHSAGYRQ